MRIALGFCAKADKLGFGKLSFVTVRFGPALSVQIGGLELAPPERTMFPAAATDGRGTGLVCPGACEPILLSTREVLTMSEAWDKAKGVASTIATAAEDAAKKAGAAATEAGETLAAEAGKAWDKAKELASVITAKADDVAGKAGEAASEAGDTLNAQASKAWDAVKSAASSAGATISEMTDSAAAAASSAVNETAAAAGKGWDATKDAATSAAEATKRAGESLGKH